MHNFSHLFGKILHIFSDRGPVRNMQSTLSNKFEKLCISLDFITRIYHGSRSSECQIGQWYVTTPYQ